MRLQIAAATWRIETKSDSAFYLITLLLIYLFVSKVEMTVTGKSAAMFEQKYRMELDIFSLRN